jgi:hypothetical protein
MVISDTTRRLLEQAAATLDTAQGELAQVNLNLAGRLAHYEAGPTFEPHPLVADVLVRAHARPPGATYQVLEFRCAAGAQVPLISRPHRSTLTILKGAIMIRRNAAEGNKGDLELRQTGDTIQFAKNEEYGCLVLTETHTILVFFL